MSRTSAVPRGTALLSREPEMSATELPELDFVVPPPGLEPLRRFALVSLEEDGVVYALRSLERPDVRLLVVPPGPFFPDYAPELDEQDTAALGLRDAEEALVLLVIQAGESPEETTANLLAPVVVNATTRAAAQVVLTGSRLPLRAPLVA
jgi:flagellar assembly factor FliW